MNDLTLVAGTAILKMVVMVAIGFLFTKLGFITKQASDNMTGVLMTIICPMLALNSFISQTYDPETSKGLLLSYAMGVIIHLLGIAVSIILVRKSNKNWPVERMAIVYGNVGFMGIPLAMAIFGTEAVFYINGISIIYNFFIWTHGSITMSGKADIKRVLKVLRAPSLVCMYIGLAVYFLRIDVPEVISAPIASIGNCTTPVAMLISGSIIARSKFKDTLKNKRTYLIVAVRLFLIPMLLFPILRVLDVPYLVALTSFTAAACPVGSMVTMFANDNNKNPSYASGLFTITTLLSLVTIPLMIMLYGKMIG